LACTILGLDEETLWQDRSAFGRLLETFYYQELRRQSTGRAQFVSFSHFRDKDGVEVDIVIESAGKIAGIEIKASSTVTEADFKGLRKLHGDTGKTFSSGVLLYDGESIVPFGPQLFAVPISYLWG